MNYRKIDAAKTRVETLKAIAKNKLRAHVHAVITDELKAFNGKKITAKLTTRLKEIFPDYTFSLDEMKEWHRYLKVYWWNQGQRMDLGHIFLGAGRGGGERFNDTECFDYAKWFESNGNTAQQILEYVAKAEKALETCEERIATYNAALGVLDAAREALHDLSYSD
jgi:hypothetical protein